MHGVGGARGGRARELKSLDSQARGTTLVSPRSIAGQSLAGGLARLGPFQRPGLTFSPTPHSAGGARGGRARELKS